MDNDGFPARLACLTGHGFIVSLLLVENLAQAKQWEVKRLPPLDEPNTVSNETCLKTDFGRPPCLGPTKLTLTED